MKYSFLIIALFAASIAVEAQETGPADTADEKSLSETDFLINDTETANDEEAAAEAPATATMGIDIGGIVQVVVIFLLILGAIYGLFLIIKKAGGSKFKNSKLINIVSSQALSSNKALHLVDLGGELYLIGVADSGVSLLSKIEDKEARDVIRLQLSAQKPEIKKTFKDIIGSAFKRNSVRDEGDESLEYLKKQGDRLKNL